jgi:hypothetical protein
MIDCPERKGSPTMLSRRNLSLSLLTLPVALNSSTAWADAADPVVGEDVSFEQLYLPPVDALDDPELFGYKPATAAQKAKAQKIIDGTPKGPSPFDVAKSFIERFAKSDRHFPMARAVNVEPARQRILFGHKSAREQRYG